MSSTQKKIQDPNTPAHLHLNSRNISKFEVFEICVVELSNGKKKNLYLLSHIGKLSWNKAKYRYDILNQRILNT